MNVVRYLRIQKDSESHLQRNLDLLVYTSHHATDGELSNIEIVSVLQQCRDLGTPVIAAEGCVDG